MSAIDFDTWMALERLYLQYAQIVDEARWDEWVNCFAEEAEYKIQPRENFERGFPLATLSLTSRGMLKDRAYGITNTLFHDPYYQRHVVSAPLVTGVVDGVIHAEANYAVFRTKLDGQSTVFNVGRYLDQVVRTPEGLRFAKRWCIFDSEMIPNSLIYPI